MELVTSALQLIAVVHDTAQIAKTNRTKMHNLADRMDSLALSVQAFEQSAQVETETIRKALQRLMNTLTQAEKFVKAHANQGYLKKTLLARKAKTEYHDIMDLLDQCVNDLSLSALATDASTSEQRVQETADVTAKAIVDSAVEREREPVLECVQCGEAFRESTNGDGHCAYHPGQPQDVVRGYRMSCCDAMHGVEQECMKLPGCTRTRHRAKHHHEFFYIRYRMWIWKEITNKVETWALAQMDDYEDNSEKLAEVGLHVSGNIFVRTGRGRRTLFLDIFGPEDLVKAARSESRIIQELKDEEGEKWYARASWVVEEGRTSGIELSAKSSSSEGPVVKFLPLTLSGDGKIAKGGDIVIKSMPQENQLIPTKEYELPAPIHEGPTFPDTVVKGATPPETRMEEGTMKMKIKPMGDVTANPQRTGFTFDRFEVELMMINSDTTDDITIIGATMQYRYVETEEWTCMESVTVSGTELPFTVEPKKAAKYVVSGQVSVPEKKDAGPMNIWITRAYVTREQPIELRITLEDTMDNTASIVLGFANSPLPLPEKAENARVFVYADDFTSYTRKYGQVTPSGTRGTVEISGNFGRMWNVDQLELRRLAFQAKKQGVDEFHCYSATDDDCALDVTALVDRDEGYVYAFRLCVRSATATATDHITIQSLRDILLKEEEIETQQETKQPAQSSSFTVSVPMRASAPPMKPERTFLCSTCAPIKHGLTSCIRCGSQILQTAMAKPARNCASCAVQSKCHKCDKMVPSVISQQRKVQLLCATCGMTKTRMCTKCNSPIPPV